MKMDAAAFVADPGLIAALLEHAVPLDCSHGRPLFAQGEEPTGLYVVLKGPVQLSLTSTVGDQILNLAAEPDSLLGLPGLIGSVGYSLSAVANKGAQVSFLSKDTFSRLMLTQPQISVMILRVLAAEVRTARMALTTA